MQLLSAIPFSVRPFIIWRRVSHGCATSIRLTNDNTGSTDSTAAGKEAYFEVLDLVLLCCREIRAAVMNTAYQQPANIRTSFHFYLIFIFLITSNRWELTFFPFFIHVIRGLGSPVAWHTKEATPPEIPIWSSGAFINVGLPGKTTRSPHEDTASDKEGTSHIHLN